MNYEAPFSNWGSEPPLIFFEHTKRTVTTLIKINFHNPELLGPKVNHVNVSKRKTYNSINEIYDYDEVGQVGGNSFFCRALLSTWYIVISSE